MPHRLSAHSTLIWLYPMSLGSIYFYACTAKRKKSGIFAIWRPLCQSLRHRFPNAQLIGVRYARLAGSGITPTGEAPHLPNRSPRPAQSVNRDSHCRDVRGGARTPATGCAAAGRAVLRCRSCSQSMAASRLRTTYWCRYAVHMVPPVAIEVVSRGCLPPRRRPRQVARRVFRDRLDVRARRTANLERLIDGDPAGSDESVESRGEEHMRQAKRHAEASAVIPPVAWHHPVAHEDGRSRSRTAWACSRWATMMAQARHTPYPAQMRIGPRPFRRRRRSRAKQRLAPMPNAAPSDLRWGK